MRSDILMLKECIDSIDCRLNEPLDNQVCLELLTDRRHLIERINHLSISDILQEMDTLIRLHEAITSCIDDSTIVSLMEDTENKLYQAKAMLFKNK